MTQFPAPSAVTTSPTADGSAGGSVDGGPTTPVRCPRCGSEATVAAAFCEACGAALSPIAPVAAPSPQAQETPIELTQPTRPQGAPSSTPVARPCGSCGGAVGADGYCENCGLKAPDPRDHYTEQPAGWVAGCCDRGVKHHRNEDAIAVAAEQAPGSRAVLVVCDGVSTSIDSDVASLAGARRARDVLAAGLPEGLGTPASRVAAITAAVQRAATEANAAVIAHTATGSENPASCTLSAAVLDGDLVVFGNVGDSRSYWIPDSGVAVQLSLDDSMAQARIEMGVSREEAETGPHAHAITKWLGRDSPDIDPQTGSMTLEGPGWLLVCSDGLWNYASEADELQGVVARLDTGGTDPLALAEALVRWACERGGKDNISAALARH